MCPRPRPHRGRASFAIGQNFREVGLHQCPSERKGEGVPVRSLRVPSHLPRHAQTAAKVRGFSLTAPGFTAETDWLLEGTGFEPVWGFSCQTCMGLFLSSVVFVWRRFFVRSGKAVLRPVACDQVRGARGRGQGTETVAKLGGLPLSGACVSQRLRPEYAER